MNVLLHMFFFRYQVIDLGFDINKSSLVIHFIILPEVFSSLLSVSPEKENKMERSYKQLLQSIHKYYTSVVMYTALAVVDVR